MKHLHSSFRSHQKVLVICLLALLAVPMLASDIEIKLRATLAGPVFNGEEPSGKAEFEVENGVKRFSVEVETCWMAPQWRFSPMAPRLGPLS